MPTKKKKVASKEKTFRALIELTFISTSKKKGVEQSVKINSSRISYIMFNYEYFDKCMPMVVMYLNVPVRLYKRLINRQKNGKLKLKIKGRNPLAKNNIAKTRLEHTFSYVTVNQTPPYDIPVDQATEEEQYRGIYLGLVDNSMTNYLRTPFNGIYHNVKLSGLLSLALQGSKNRKYTIEPFKYDYDYNQVLVPACSTRQKFLEFLYDYDQFYDDNFEFFIDFKKVYLLSQSGNGGSGKINSKRNMIIDIRPIDDEKSYKDGYSKKDDSIYLYINQMDVSVNTNTSAEQIANKVVSYGERRDPKEYKITDGERVVFVRSGSSDDPTTEAKEQIQSATTVIELTKNNITDSIFEPARVISVKMYDDYKSYSGKYKLYYKRVMYKNDGDGEFLVNVNVGLIPTGEALPAKAKKDRNKKSKAVSNSAKKKVSADEQGKSIPRSEYAEYIEEEESRELR